ncbi:MAG: hypothetical protein A2Y53_06520 [Chloroflexi bacterium RBG_16_47_49]|nr:MAG: hypothetical protein A2Y53_06520 [Chloroflexi bacterium RBG_16_47_49]
MTTDQTKKPRPYWHLDAKWITGILLLLLLNLTFFIYFLMQLTAPAQGITLLSTILASSFSFESGGLDAAGDIEIMRQKIAESPSGEWQPIPGLQIVVREQDIAGKTPREARLWFFSLLAEPIYYQGQQGLASLMTDPEMKTSLQGGVGPLGFISAQTHGNLTIFFAVSALASLLFLGLLIYFSYRFGRLGSPGCIIFMAAIPGLLLLLFSRGWLAQVASNPTPLSEPSALARYGQLAADVVPVILQTATRLYLSLLGLGVLLMLLAFIGSIFVREKKALPGSA